MVEVSVTGSNVRFSVLGRDRLYAVKRKIDVPAAHIAGVRRAGADLGRPAGIRLAGASLPGVIYCRKLPRFGRLDVLGRTGEGCGECDRRRPEGRLLHATRGRSARPRRRCQRH